MADDVETRLAALVRARDSGVLTVRHGDTMTTFRSLAELNAIISGLTGDVAAVGGGSPIRTRLRYPMQMSKGL